MNHSSRSNITRLAIGRLISVTGGAAAYTALMFTVWDSTHSALWQSGTLLLTFGVVGILAPLTGQLGDRFDRRKVMIWAELIAAIFFAIMAFVDRPGALVPLAFFSAIAEAPFWSASSAAIPALAESEEEIAHANSLLGIGRNAGIMVGPVIGGVLVGGIGAGWVFGLNAATFLVSVLITISVRGSYSQPRTAQEEEEHRGMSAGIRFLWNERALRRMTLAWLVFLLGAGIGMVADAPLADSFNAGPTGFGWLITVWGGGSVLGSLLGRKLTARTEPMWLVLGAGGIALGHLGVGLAPLFSVVLVFGLFMGVSDGLTMVAETGIMQRRTPDAVRSRVMAAFDAALSLGLAVAYIFAGPVLDAVGPQKVYLLGGVAAVAATAMLLPLWRLGGETAEEADALNEPERPVRTMPDTG
jgi:MFS family permease